jgi:hypothetical protein
MIISSIGPGTVFSGTVGDYFVESSDAALIFSFPNN